MSQMYVLKYMFLYAMHSAITCMRSVYHIQLIMHNIVIQNGAVMCVLQDTFSIQFSLTVDQFQVHYKSLARELYYTSTWISTYICRMMPAVSNIDFCMTFCTYSMHGV